MSMLEPYQQSDYQVYPGCSPLDFAQWFLTHKQITLEAFCMKEGISLDAIVPLIEEVLTEWELKEETHPSRKEAVSHLINHIRIKKNAKQRNNTTRQGFYASGRDAGHNERMARIAEEILRQSAGGNKP